MKDTVKVRQGLYTTTLFENFQKFPQNFSRGQPRPDSYQRQELSELKSRVIHSTSDSNQLVDRLKAIDRANDASRERLRNLKEDMINLNVKVDNITEKLIMDRLGLMDGDSSFSGFDMFLLVRNAVSNVIFGSFRYFHTKK